MYVPIGKLYTICFISIVFKLHVIGYLLSSIEIIHMKNQNYRVSRATVYNTLELLVNCDLVKKHQFGKNIAQFEKAYHCMQHDHLIDMDSGKVIEFCDPRIDEIIKTACELNNFRPSHHSLYIYGYSEEDKDTK